MRLIHIGDTLVPVDPVTFGARLTALAFEGVIVERNSDAFGFQARRPVSRTLQHDKLSDETSSLTAASL